MATQLRDIRPTPSLLERAAGAVAACDTFFAAAKASVGAAVTARGVDAEQYAAHGLAWVKVYVESLREMHGWAERLEAQGAFHEREQLILGAAFAEYLARLAGGLPMSQGEVIRPQDLYLDDAAVHAFTSDPHVADLMLTGWTAEAKTRLGQLIEDGDFGNWGLDDESLDMIRDQFRRFSDEVVKPHAHKWHEQDQLIPLEVIEQVAEMGVFGLTVDEAYGGLGMGKVAMCVVTEELSRGYIGVGSLGTRNEIAGELIQLGGTEEQKQYYLPKLASGEILPTAVFTEPNTGSDLASLQTRAVPDGDVWKITGAKTWITHAARADLMTVLVRTNPNEKGYKGLSMMLAEKTRGTDENPFPDAGIDGGEIEVLGYRGMKEYTLSFDGFEVAKDNLLGGVEGQGFKQLMATFEGARIQTAARAVGVAQAALEVGLQYAKDRKQFGQPLFAFPRVHGKLAWMAVEIMIARQLTLYSAREKDAGRRCDLEAGLAKLIGAQVAWSAADNALQIHGGNGYALEYEISRILCDARILNIFEGAAEIQAQVIARRLLG
ncbi:MAG: acyl-CoA dehydrogenase [Geminicoccaceae bacterium]|nr:MAG: acyl-CoA dehydrogenase [Geminicoccaceae bacterium]